MVVKESDVYYQGFKMKIYPLNSQNFYYCQGYTETKVTNTKFIKQYYTALLENNVPKY